MIATAAPGAGVQDPKLNGLEPQVEVSNQTVAAPPRPICNRSPSSRNAGRFVSHRHGKLHCDWLACRGVGGWRHEWHFVTTAISTLAANGSWDLDLWAKSAARSKAMSRAQVNDADLANARSHPIALATAYYNLRAADALQVLLDQTVVAYKRLWT